MPAGQTEGMYAAPPLEIILICISPTEKEVPSVQWSTPLFMEGTPVLSTPQMAEAALASQAVHCDIWVTEQEPLLIAHTDVFIFPVIPVPAPVPGVVPGVITTDGGWMDWKRKRWDLGPLRGRSRQTG